MQVDSICNTYVMICNCLNNVIYASIVLKRD